MIGEEPSGCLHCILLTLMGRAMTRGREPAEVVHALLQVAAEISTICMDGDDAAETRETLLAVCGELFDEASTDQPDGTAH